VDDSAVLRGLPHAVLVLGPDGLIGYANDAAARLTADGALVGRDPLDLVEPAHRERAGGLLGALRSATAGTVGPARFRLRGGSGAWVAVSGSPGPAGRTRLSLTRVADRAGDECRLHGSERRFRAAFEAAAHGTCLLDAAGRVVEANAALAEMLGRGREDLVGVPVLELVDRPPLPATDRHAPATVARRLRHADGRLLHVQVTVTPVRDDVGEPLTLVQVQDVTERRRSEKQLRRLALHDQLTGLPARTLLLEHLHTALEQRSRAAPLVAVLFIDLDEFKLVNDALGHAVGDTVLRETARRLRTVTRPQDTVARLSGDEFVVVCPALADEQEAVAIADRLAEVLREPVSTDTDEVLVSASVGVAFSSGSAPAPEDLLRDADAAMYRAKQLGRRRYEVFDAALRERAGSRLRVRALLGRAQARGRVVVHYQPVVELATSRVVGLEALLRLRDDDGSTLAPEGLEVAVEAGLLGELRHALLREAAGQVAAWSAQCGRPLGLSAQLCPAQLDEGLPDTVVEVLREAGLRPDQLLLEVSEQTLTAAGAAAQQWLRALQPAGVRLALDDFGTGGGSLTCLRVLPVSVLKVAGSFVAQVPGSARDLAVVRAVLGLAEQLGLHTTVQGVDTPEQHDALVPLATGCAQGLLYGPPVPAGQVPAVLARLGVGRGVGWPAPRAAYEPASARS